MQGEEIFETIPEWAQLSQGGKRIRPKNQNQVTLTQNFLWILFHYSTYLPLLSFGLKILKAFWKTFPTNMKPTKCQSKGKNEARKAQRRGEEQKRRKSLDFCVPCESKTWFQNFAFCVCWNFNCWKLTFWIWMRRPILNRIWLN